MSILVPTQTDPPPTAAPPLRRRRLIRALTSRRGAWATLLFALLLSTALLGTLRGDTQVGGGAAGDLPATAESQQVVELLRRFPGSDQAPAVVVWERADGAALTEADLAAVTMQGREAAAVVGAHPVPPRVATDQRAALTPVLLPVDRPDAEVAATVTQLRTRLAEHATPGLTAYVTGGPAFGADVAASFDGADLTLLAVTIGVVALLLLLTYRSPVLWLVPLTVVALADQVANVLAARAGEAWGLSFDGGIISVLVFGAGTNYALLLVSRYREELGRDSDHRGALRNAWTATAPAIVASNLTVVLSLLALVLAVVPSTSGLGIASAIGLLVALAFGLLVLPAALAVVGRKVFWPFVPRPGRGQPSHGTWARIAGLAVGHPAAVAVSGLVLLGILSAGLVGVRIGLAPAEKFRVAAESQVGFEVLAGHFPAGETAPAVIVSRADALPDVASAVSEVDGVVRVSPAATSTDGLARLSVVTAHAPGTPDSDALVRSLRAAVRAVPGADAQVGGEAAALVDQRDAALRDLGVVAPVILGLVLVVLIGLLRALVTPVVLLVLNALSALAAIGLGAWVGRVVLGLEALDVNVPLLAFMFLVALGVDYTIFLVHRARSEARDHGTVEGMVRAVTATGGVITSAGVVLAAVFAALGVLPLMTLTQLGIIVGLGVLIDTLLVRTLIVPAVFALLGDRVWWPGSGPRPVR